MRPITNLEQLIEGKRYFIENNMRQRQRFKGTFIEKAPIEIRGPYQQIDDDGETHEYIFTGALIRHDAEGQEILIPKRDYKIKQSQVTSGQVLVYPNRSDKIVVDTFFRKNLPNRAFPELNAYTRSFLPPNLGGRKRMQTKGKSYKKSNSRSKTRKTRK